MSDATAATIGESGVAALCPALSPVLGHNVATTAARNRPRRAEGAGVQSRDAEDERLRTLMAGYQAGQREAFEDLHAQLTPLLRRLLYRLARDPVRVDDLLQETFLQMHRARHTYDAAFPLWPWVAAIARHVFLMDCRYRRRRGDLARQEPLDETTAGEEQGREAALVAGSSVRHALSQLSAVTRQSVLLHHLHGLTFEEIAERLHVGSPALRARASRGMAHLRSLLETGRNDHEQPR